MKAIKRAEEKFTKALAWEKIIEALKFVGEHIMNIIHKKIKIYKHYKTKSKNKREG